MSKRNAEKVQTHFCSLCWDNTTYRYGKIAIANAKGEDALPLLIELEKQVKTFLKGCDA